jgi:hypothetical protein
MVLSETRSPRIGLTLFRVLRKGLWLGEYLGGLRVAGRTPKMRLPPAPTSRTLEPPRETRSHRRFGSETRYCACTASFAGS